MHTENIITVAIVATGATGAIVAVKTLAGFLISMFSTASMISTIVY